MRRLWRAGVTGLLALCLVAASACSVTINAGPTPTPSPSSTATPANAAQKVSTVITSSLDTGRCETSASVKILVDGQDLGTMTVASQVIQTDRMTVMLTPGSHKYTLQGTADVQSNGQVSTLKASGKGEVGVSGGTNSWTLQVDGSRLAAGVCPTPGSTWPLVLETS